MEYVLEAIGITKRFPGVLANDNVSLNVKPGEILGLIGENGAGKSTFLKVLNGIHPSGSYEGTLKLEGKEIHPASPNEALELGIGYVPQEINVLKYFSVAENIYMSDQTMQRDLPPKQRKKTPFSNFRAMYEATEKLMKENHINLDPRADVRKLSIGQQQMLMIARALAQDPKVLILDEPTTSLSETDVADLFEVVRHLKSKGTGIIFVTHKLAEILELTDRVTILRDGKYITTYEKAEYDTGKIIQGMIGRSISNMYEKRNNPIGEEVMRVEDITIEHPYIANRNLIDHVSFSVRAGEVLGLSGLVGAGRSEVCMGIYGMLPVKSGKIFINGKEVTIKDSSDAVKNGIGFVSEDRKKYGLNFVWDIKNNIAISNLNALSTGFVVNDKKIKGRAKKYYDELRVKANSVNTKVGTLSGGNQQKVVIARTLNSEPKIIILDEPTKGIDVGSKNEIYHIINDLAAQGAAIVMISSELPELMGMSDRVVVMAEGHKVGELEGDEITDTRIMEMATTTFKNVKA